jgi:uncharacterized protein
MPSAALTGWEPPGFFFIGSLPNYWGSLLVALGWVGLVMLAVRRGWWDGLRARFAAVGRMAFTNYIAQSVICTWIFYGHGLGLFGRVALAKPRLPETAADAARLKPG